MTALDRFFKYVKVDTRSDEDSKEIPSSKGQVELLELIEKEFSSIGIITDFDRNCGILYAKIPKNIDGFSSIGFISHVDTYHEVNGKNVNPNIIYNYNGNDIQLNETIRMRTNEFPSLLEYINKTLIVTDGNTLLGADDKAGIAEIMTMAEYFVNHEEIKHGDICIAFTPDEEIGKGIDNFNIERFGADFAYTVDGEKLGEICFENFNAYEVKIHIKGNNAHTGYAKNVIINPSYIACKINSLLPPNEVPRETEGDEGFYHLISINSSSDYAEMRYNLRDFDKDGMQKRIEKLKQIVNSINEEYEKNVVEIEFIKQYENMKEIIEDKMFLIENVEEAAKNIGINTFISKIRGGTDGATLSYKGLPCPNLGTGARNFHGIYEFVCLEDMEAVSNILIEIVKKFVF